MNDKPIPYCLQLSDQRKGLDSISNHCHFTLRHVIPRPMSKLLQVEKNETT